LILSKNDSGNKKLGKKIRTTYRPVGPSCPATCQHLKSGSCYADFGRTAMHARGSQATESDGERLVDWVSSMPKGRVVRHHVSGDIMRNGVIDDDYVDAIYRAHARRPDIPGWGYTHAWRMISPLKLNHDSLTFNASCDSLEQVDEAIDAGWSATVTLEHMEAPDHVIKTPKGRRVVVCPEQTSGTPCSKCKLCWKGDRKAVVGFLLHGSGKRKYQASPSSNSTGATSTVTVPADTASTLT